MKGTRDHGSGIGGEVTGQSGLLIRSNSVQRTLVPIPRSLIPFLLLFICISVSCIRFGENVASIPFASEEKPSARPLAILKTGRQPLWFQLTDNGPLHLESIEDAVFSAAFIPWTLALHICDFYENNDELVMAVNRDGFLKLALNNGSAEELALYRFGGGTFWKQYTIGSFVFHDEKPAVLLYLDDRFLDTSASVPSPRTWTFNMESNIPFPLEIPALEFFPAEEGWNVNALRLGIDGFWYFRVIKKYASQPEVRMLRTVNLSNAGVDASLDDFQNSASQKIKIDNPFLPPLPQGYVYTGEAVIGGSIFACWEEQEDYSIGAAGFMLMANPAAVRK